jgi:hypothetical protein
MFYKFTKEESVKKSFMNRNFDREKDAVARLFVEQYFNLLHV